MELITLSTTKRSFMQENNKKKKILHGEDANKKHPESCPNIINEM
jgi:hypothetical protein